MGGLLNVVQSVKHQKTTNSNFHKQIEMQIRELMRRTGVEVDEEKLEKLAKYMKPMKQQNEIHGLNLVELMLNNVQKCYEFMVMKNCSSVVLGIDFINDWKIKSDFAKKNYQIGDDTQKYKFLRSKTSKK